MIRCAAAYSSPPKVCTYCTEEYIALKQVEYKLHKLVSSSLLQRILISENICYEALWVFAESAEAMIYGFGFKQIYPRTLTFYIQSFDYPLINLTVERCPFFSVSWWYSFQKLISNFKVVWNCRKTCFHMTIQHAIV